MRSGVRFRFSRGTDRLIVDAWQRQRRAEGEEARRRQRRDDRRRPVKGQGRLPGQRIDQLPGAW